eukprot:287762_1
MEERMDDGREDRGGGEQPGEFSSSLDDAFSSYSIRELKRILSESGVDLIKEGLIERADLVRRARELELSDSRLYPSTSPSLSSIVRERGEGGAGVADVDDSLHNEIREEEAVQTELTSEQAEKILPFIAVTKADTQEARYILEAMAWDIDAAVGMYMESKSRSRVDESGTGLGTAGIRATANDEEFVDYGGEIQNTGFPPVSSIIDSVTSEDRDEGKSQQHLSNEIIQPMEAPPHIYYSGDEVSSTREEIMSPTCGNAASSVISDRYSNGGVDEDGIRAPLPTVRDTLLSDGVFHGNFMAAYDSGGEEQEDSSTWIFSPPEGLSATTSFKHTKILCERQERWLLINIQDPQIIASHNLNRDVWGDETVQSIIQAFFVFWQRSSISQQAEEFLRRYHIASDKLPHTSILDPRTGLMLLQIEGYIEKEDMCMMLVDFLEKNQVGQTKAPRLRTISISGTASCISAKESEEEESKQGNEDDQECQQINVDHVDEGSCLSSIDFQVVEEKKAAADADTDAPSCVMTESENSLPPIMVMPPPPEPSIDAVDAIRVQLKLPDGGKAIARRFLKMDSVEHLFEVARSLLPPEQRDQPFDITLDFPPRSLLHLKSKTLSETDASGAALALRWLH